MLSSRDEDKPIPARRYIVIVSDVYECLWREALGGYGRRSVMRVHVTACATIARDDVDTKEVG